MLRQEKRNLILATAEKNIKIYGLSYFRISQLCTDIHISKRTFYKIFDSKEEFLKELYLNMLITSYEAVVFILQAKTSFIKKIEDISKIIEARFKLFNNDTMAELKKLYPSIYLEVEFFQNERIKPLFMLLIKKAQKHKIINDFEPKFLITLFFEIITSMFTENLRNVSNGKNSYCFRDVFDLVLNGLLTKKGKSILNYNLLKGTEQ
jgi:AcrR family transcriptional regulator